MGACLCVQEQTASDKRLLGTRALSPKRPQRENFRDEKHLDVILGHGLQPLGRESSLPSPKPLCHINPVGSLLEKPTRILRTAPEAHMTQALVHMVPS